MTRRRVRDDAGARARTRHGGSSLAGALVGFAFLAKELQAFLVLPGVRARVPHRRAARGSVAGMWQLHPARAQRRSSAGGWWVAIVSAVAGVVASVHRRLAEQQLLERALRVQRLRPAHRQRDRQRRRRRPRGSGGGQWGPTGWTRLFNDAFGGQASWLIPAALILARRRARVDAACDRAPTARVPRWCCGAAGCSSPASRSASARGSSTSTTRSRSRPRSARWSASAACSMWRHRDHAVRARVALARERRRHRVVGGRAARPHARLDARARTPRAHRRDRRRRSRCSFPIAHDARRASRSRSRRSCVGLLAPAAYTLVDGPPVPERRASRSPARRSGSVAVAGGRRRSARWPRRRRLRPGRATGPSDRRAPPTGTGGIPGGGHGGRAGRRRRWRRHGRAAQRQPGRRAARASCSRTAATATAGSRRRSAPTTRRATSSPRASRSWRSAASTAAIPPRRSPSSRSTSPTARSTTSSAVAAASAAAGPAAAWPRRQHVERDLDLGHGELHRPAPSTA